MFSNWCVCSVLCRVYCCVLCGESVCLCWFASVVVLQVFSEVFSVPAIVTVRVWILARALFACLLVCCFILAAGVTASPSPYHARFAVVCSKTLHP